MTNPDPYIINRTSRRRVLVCSKEMMEEKIEPVLNARSQLKQVARNLLQHSNIDKVPSSPSSELLRSDEDSGNNELDLADINYCSSLCECTSYTNDKMEGTGDSMAAYK